MKFDFDQGEYEGSGDIRIHDADESQRVFVNGIEYTATGQGEIPRVFRAVRDSDGDFWIENGGLWSLMKFDTIRKGSLRELAQKHGPLATE
jgi:hypothetical protein